MSQSHSQFIYTLPSFGAARNSKHVRMPAPLSWGSMRLLSLTSQAFRFMAQPQKEQRQTRQDTSRDGGSVEMKGSIKLNKLQTCSSAKMLLSRSSWTAGYRFRHGHSMPLKASKATVWGSHTEQQVIHKLFLSEGLTINRDMRLGIHQAPLNVFLEWTTQLFTPRASFAKGTAAHIYTPAVA